MPAPRSNYFLQLKGSLYLQGFHMDHPVGFLQGFGEADGADSITLNPWERIRRKESNLLSFQDMVIVRFASTLPSHQGATAHTK